MAAPYGHIHVTEREPDGTWEDCTFTAGLMYARLCKSLSIPATHAEMERLRDAQPDQYGGANNYDLKAGLSNRYDWYGGSIVRGFSSLWSNLWRGRAAAVQGSMGAFPYGHSLRRWDPGFRGAHEVLVVRMDGWDRVWWDDPLAPVGAGYTGQWVSKADLKRFVDALVSAGGTSLVATVTAKPPSGPAPHWRARVTTPTPLWNPSTKRWVFNGENRLPTSIVLDVRAAQYTMGGVATYPTDGKWHLSNGVWVKRSTYSGYFVPVKNVRLVSRV